MRILLIVSLIAFSVGLVSCGPSKSGLDMSSEDFSSRADVTNPGTRNGLPVALAECTAIATNSMGLEGNLTTFYDPFSDAYIPDLIRVQLSRVPNVLMTTNNMYLQFFAYSSTAKQGRTYGESPINIVFQNKTTGRTLNESSPVTRISKATLQKMIVDKNLSSSGVTLANFLERHIVVLKDVALSYDAVTIALYDSASGSEVQQSQDVLLPAFAANPNVYALDHDSSHLQQLHPFWSLRQSGWSDEQYRKYSYNFCIAK